MIPVSKACGMPSEAMPDEPDVTNPRKTSGCLKCQLRGTLMYGGWQDFYCEVQGGRFLCHPGSNEPAARASKAPAHTVVLHGTLLTVDHNTDRDSKRFKLKADDPGAAAKALHIDAPGTLHFEAEDHQDLLSWLHGLASVPGLYRRAEDFFEVGAEIGSGATCKALAVRDRLHASQEYVLKVPVDPKEPSKEYNRRMRTELDILQKAVQHRHPSLPHLQDFFFDPAGKISIVMEFCRGGDLDVLMARKERFTEQEAQHVFRQVVDGISFLHSQGIAHRDLKPDNIMIRSREGPMEAVICDFDLARIDYSPNWQGRTPCGTTNYMAPEIIGRDRSYGLAIDMWSLGCVLWFLLAGKPAFDETKTDEEIEEDIRNQRFTMSDQEWIKEIPELARDLAEKLLKYDPQERLTAAECLKHDWITKDLTSAPERSLPSIRNFRASFSAKDLEDLVSRDPGTLFGAKRRLRKNRMVPPEGIPQAVDDPGTGQNEASAGRQGRIAGLQVLLEQGQAVGQIRVGEEAGRSLRQRPDSQGAAAGGGKASMDTVNSMLDYMGAESVIESRINEEAGEGLQQAAAASGRVAC